MAAVALFAALAFSPAGVTPVRAAGTTYVVTSTADDVNDANCTTASCTLRQAVNAANANDPGTETNTITFGDTFSGAQTITLGGTLTPTRSVTIDATVGNRSVTISGNNAVRLFVVNGGVTLGLRGLTLANGNGGPNNGNNGGAIDNQYGTVNVTGSTFTGNNASYGGAINNGGTLTVTNSTFSGNGANFLDGGRGGAIYNGGTAVVTGSTFTGNNAHYGAIRLDTFQPKPGYGGAIYNNNEYLGSSRLSLAFSILAGNSAAVGPDLYKFLDTNGGGNVIGITDGNPFISGGPTDKVNVNALLGPLGSYGGPVPTVPLLPGSPAIDIAACPAGLAGDARGVGRPQGANCDAGAFESRGFAAGTPTGDGQSAKLSTAFGSAVGLTVSGADGEPVAGGEVTFTITPNLGASATFGTASGCTVTTLNTVAVCTVSGNGTVTSPTFTANGTAGGFTIVATAIGLPTTTFTETTSTQTYVVTSAADDVNDANCTAARCTLRQAVNASNNNHPGTQANTITFGDTFGSAQTITLGGTLTPTRSVTIDATVGNRSVTISGGGAVRLFEVNNGVTLGLHGLTLANGNAGDIVGGGGAIYNNATVNVTGSTFSGNQASRRGGAIGNDGTVTITGSTFSGNVSSLRGGAIGSTGTATITGSTFSGNNGGSQGGAINNSSGGVAGTLTLALSVVAGNSAGAGPDINGTVISGGGNVIGNTSNTGGFVASDRTGVANPGLGTLGSYGGPVQTFALLPGSPAIDIAACPTGLASDARGVGRPQGANCDAGAFESRGFAAGTATGDGQSAAITTQFASAVGLTVSGADGEPVGGGQVTFTITPNMGAGATFTGTPPSGCTLAALNTEAVCAIPAGGTVASPAFTANGTAGGFTIVAAAGGVPTTTFTATNTGAGTAPAAVADSYTAAVNATLTVPAATGVLANDTLGAPAATITAGTQPAHGMVTLSAGDGGFTYTPTAGYTGADAFTYTLTNSAGVSTATVNLTVTGTVNQPPAITSADHATFTVGTAGSFTVTTTAGFPTATTITKTGALPAGVTFTDNGDGTATLAGTPTAAGSFPITITASNGVAPSATQAFTLTVNQAPGITSADHATFVAGTAGSFTVTTSPAADTVTETKSLPAGVTFTDNGDGTATLAGTPAAGTGGVYALTFTATNATGFTMQGFTLTVNQPPAITSADHATFTVGAASSFTVTTTAGFPAATTITATGTLPAGVSFTDNGNGTATIAGSPSAGTAGGYPLTITATNAAGNPQQAFTLTVTPANASPVITSADHATFASGAAGSFTVTTTAGFPAATTLTKTGALPAGVTFTDNGDGTATLAGTPTAAGAFPLTITASNGVTIDATQSFTLTVTKKSTKTPTTITLTSSLNPAVVGQAVTFTARVSPAGATGVVTFMDGAATLGTVPLVNGQATLTTAALAPGRHGITAVYGGDATYAGSTSAQLSQVVAKGKTTVTLTSSANPSVVGQAVTFTAQVAPAGATGTVTFMDGNKVLGPATLVNGQATFATAALGAGNHTITAVYGGDATYAGSTSAALSQVVKRK